MTEVQLLTQHPQEILCPAIDSFRFSSRRHPPPTFKKAKEIRIHDMPPDQWSILRAAAGAPFEHPECSLLVGLWSLDRVQTSLCFTLIFLFSHQSKRGLEWISNKETKSASNAKGGVACTNLRRDVFISDVDWTEEIRERAVALPIWIDYRRRGGNLRPH